MYGAHGAGNQFGTWKGTGEREQVTEKAETDRC